MRYFLLAGALALTVATISSAAEGTKSDADKVIVSRGGVQLTMGDIDAYMETIPEKDRAGTLENPDRAEKLLTGLLLTRQLAQQARELKIDKRDMTRRLLAITDDQILAKIRIDEYVATLKMPDMTILAKERYAADKAQYTQPEKISVQHILISTEKHPEAEAHALADTIYKQASADAAGFAALVEKYSEDPGKAHNGGMIADATSPRIAPEFAAAAKTLRKPNEIAPLIKTKFGYHIVMLVSYQPAVQQTFADVEPKLVATLKDQYIENQRNQFLGLLSTEKNVTDAEAFSSLRQRYLQAGQQTPTQMNETSPSTQGSSQH